MSQTVRNASSAASIAFFAALAFGVSRPVMSQVGGNERDSRTAAIVMAVLEAVSIDSLCQPKRCSVIVVDSALRSARNTHGLDVFRLPIIATIPGGTLAGVHRPGVRMVRGSLRHGRPKADTAWVALAFTPGSLSMRDSGSVSLTIAIPDQLGVVAVTQVVRRRDRWLVRRVQYYPG